MSTPTVSKRWGVEQDNKGDVHVFPIDDLLEHEGDDTCTCLPWIEIGKTTFKYMIVHNAWDGRE